MKMLTCFIAISLVFGLAGVAKADTDFQMVVIDPFAGPYNINPINGTSISFMFTECEEPGQLPAGADYDGCWSGQNDNTYALTSLNIVVNGLIDGQVPGCSPFGTIGTYSDLFPSATCSTTSTGYVLNYNGGTGLAPGGIVTIAEAGVEDLSTFPEVTGTFNAPEPPAFWLLFAGVLGGGFLLNQRRRAYQV